MVGFANLPSPPPPIQTSVKIRDFEAPYLPGALSSGMRQISVTGPCQKLKKKGLLPKAWSETKFNDNWVFPPSTSEFKCWLASRQLQGGSLSRMESKGFSSDLILYSLPTWVASLSNGEQRPRRLVKEAVCLSEPAQHLRLPCSVPVFFSTPAINVAVPLAPAQLQYRHIRVRRASLLLQPLPQRIHQRFLLWVSTLNYVYIGMFTIFWQSDVQAIHNPQRYKRREEMGRSHWALFWCYKMI